MNRGYNNSNNQGTAGYNAGGGFRGGRGGPYNNRGGMNPMGGYARGGYQQAPQQPMPSGYQTPGYPGGNAMPQPYGGFQGRGGYQGGGGGMRGGNMGMRGGRGGMNGGMMGMPMGMNPAMPVQIPMGMPQMNAGMGMQGMHPAFNSASFGLPSPQQTSMAHSLQAGRGALPASSSSHTPQPLPAGAELLVLPSDAIPARLR